jgi:hypothetical protein
MTAGQTRLEARIRANRRTMGGPLSAPFILARASNMPGLRRQGHTLPSSGSPAATDGLIGLGEVQLPPFRASGRWTGW